MDHNSKHFLLLCLATPIFGCAAPTAAPPDDLGTEAKGDKITGSTAFKCDLNTGQAYLSSGFHYEDTWSGPESVRVLLEIKRCLPFGHRVTVAPASSGCSVVKCFNDSALEGAGCVAAAPEGVSHIAVDMQFDCDWNLTFDDSDDLAIYVERINPGNLVRSTLDCDETGYEGYALSASVIDGESTPAYRASTPSPCGDAVEAPAVWEQPEPPSTDALVSDGCIDYTDLEADRSVGLSPERVPGALMAEYEWRNNGLLLLNPHLPWEVHNRERSMKVLCRHNAGGTGRIVDWCYEPYQNVLWATSPSANPAGVPLRRVLDGLCDRVEVWSVPEHTSW